MPNIETLVEEYGKLIYGLCRKLTDSIHDADDLYQQTFLIAMGKDFREDGNSRALLVSICIAQHKNDVRKKHRRQRIAPITELEPDAVGTFSGPETEMERREQLAALRRIVANLEEKCRLPVLLYYGMEMPVEEIAQALHIPAGTVKSRLFAARKKIKRELEVTGYDG